MDVRFWTAVTLAKLLHGLIRLSGGGGTAAPGLLAEYIDPKLLRKLSNFYSEAILITGTNGKTTTARLISAILSEVKTPFIHNRAGSNLLRGLIGTMVYNLNFFDSKPKKLALLEVDEATLPIATASTKPKLIIFNNLFRDQLDRYGEVETIRKIWQKAIVSLDSHTTLILNADDPSVAHLAKSSKAKAVYFGVEDPDLSLGKLPHASDYTNCINCGSTLHFTQVYLSHLGNYQCTKCGLKRPKRDIAVEKVTFEADKGFTAVINTPKERLEIKIALPGLYNVYNTAAAVAAALAIGIDLDTIKKALEKFRAAFGRTEGIEMDGKRMFITLVKNPTGFNEALRTISNAGDGPNFLLIAINDLIADGRDVSWLWDVDFEVYLNKNVRGVWVSGIRAADMVLRLKYAREDLHLKASEALEETVLAAFEEVPVGATLYVLPTYTAMLEIKKILADRGVSARFWED